jgi:hypothetical protein
MLPLYILTLTLLSRLSAAHYTLVEDLTTAEKFWDAFDFFAGPDPTQGHVKFVDTTTANSSSLAGQIITKYGPAIYMGVDFKSAAPQGRQSIRLTSKKTHTHALWITDILHAPSVPGGWPAYWLLGQGAEWPLAGEVDIFEQVNNASSNKMTLHTKPGLAISDDLSGMATGSKIATKNCDVNAAGQDKNVGCGIGMPAGTFGDAFNQNDGGVFATEVTSTGIKSWFFPRNALPQGVDFNDPQSTENWPKPNALWTAKDVNFDDYFKNLQMIWDITFCGDWAGAVWESSGYTALAPTCKEFVANHPEAFQDAYFATYGTKIFEDDDMNSAAPAAGSTSPSSASAAAPPASSAAAPTRNTYRKRGTAFSG